MKEKVENTDDNMLSAFRVSTDGCWKKKSIVIIKCYLDKTCPLWSWQYLYFCALNKVCLS